MVLSIGHKAQPKIKISSVRQVKYNKNSSGPEHAGNVIQISFHVKFPRRTPKSQAFHRNSLVSLLHITVHIGGLGITCTSYSSLSRFFECRYSAQHPYFIRTPATLNIRTKGLERVFCSLECRGIFSLSELGSRSSTCRQV